jgi:hypothetical protein
MTAKTKILPRGDAKKASTVGTERIDRRTIKPKTGKSSNPEFVSQMTYIRETTKKAVQKRLIDEDSGMDFSELVESLLAKWLKQ